MIKVILNLFLFYGCITTYNGAKRTVLVEQNNELFSLLNIH